MQGLLFAKIHSYFFSFSYRSKVFIVWAALGIIFVVGIVLIASFSWYTRTQLLRMQAVYTSQINTAQHVVQAHTQLMQEKNEAEKKLSLLLERELKQQAHVDFMLSLLKEQNLICKQMVPLHTGHDSLFNKDYFRVNISGRFIQLLTFFKLLNQAGRPIKFKHVRLMRSKQKEEVRLYAFVRLVTPKGELA